MIRFLSLSMLSLGLFAFAGCGESGNKVIDTSEPVEGVMTDAEMEAYNNQAFGGPTESNK